MADAPLRAVIAGGGLSGLTCAYRLQSRLTMLGKPFEIFLFEAGSRLGGQVHTERQNGFLLDYGPEAFLPDKPRGMGFCHDLAITRHFVMPRVEYPVWRIVKKHRLVSLPRGFYGTAPTDPISMLATPLLSIKAKARLLKEFFLPPRQGPDESVGAFVRRRFGPEVVERLVQPVMTGLLGGDADRLSMAANFARLAKLEEKGSFFRQTWDVLRGAAIVEASGARFSSMITFQDGMQTLIDQVGKHLTQVGAQLRTSVTQLAVHGTGWRVGLSSGQTLETDAVCLALPAAATAHLVEEIDPALAKIIADIPHADAVTTHFALKDTDWTPPAKTAAIFAPLSERKAYSGCFFEHRRFPHRADTGMALLRVLSLGRVTMPLLTMSDDEVQKRLWNDLRPVLKLKGMPLFSRVTRHPKSVPILSVGHQDRMEAARQHLTALPTLGLIGGWRQGSGIADCIDVAERAADKMVMDLCRM